MTARREELTISGMATPRTFAADELDALSDPRGLAVAAVLDEIDIDTGATRVHVISRDETYSASIPIEDIRSGGRLTVEDDGLRLRVLDGTTLCWNVKDVGTLRLTATREPDSVPERPTH